ncbi:MAG: tungsten cofactor oxidoreductase radical SAM maturase [Candidatus Hodarchaeota archaeon]
MVEARVNNGFIRVPTKLKENSKIYVERVDEQSILLIPVSLDLEKVYIEPTTHCNLSCIMCVRNVWEDDHTEMAFSDFEKIVEDLKEFPMLGEVTFGGYGEPFAHKNILDMVRLVKEDLGAKVRVSTNGTLIGENAQEIIKSGIDTLIVSLDAVSSDKYKDIRGFDINSIESNIRTVIEEKKCLKSRIPIIEIEFVAMKNNIDELKKVIDFAHEINDVDRILVTNVFAHTEKMSEERLYPGDKEVLFLDFSKYALSRLMKLSLPQTDITTERYCQFILNNSCVISATGNVYPCYRLMHTYPAYIQDRVKRVVHHPFGNVFNEKLGKIWTSEEYVRFRNKVRRFGFPSCPDCVFRDGCWFVEETVLDCWYNSPSCADCLWSRGIIRCP